MPRTRAAWRLWPRSFSMPPTWETEVSYIDESLVEGETLVHRARISWGSQFPLIVLVLVTLVIVVCLVFLVMASIRVRSTELAITILRRIAKTGFLNPLTVSFNPDTD